MCQVLSIRDIQTYYKNTITSVTQVSHVNDRGVTSTEKFVLRNAAQLIMRCNQTTRNGK